ncbi:MAG: hypothetical protein HY057_09375 [Rhodospirillales bacterium]|nr:hypothetical protein [Rhodospirillales bacterium]
MWTIRDWLRYLSKILSYTWFMLTVAWGGPFILIVNQQGQDLLRDLAERSRGPALVAFFFAALLLAGNAWYWAQKVMLPFGGRFPPPAKWPPYFTLFVRWYPRVIGAGALALTALACAIAARTMHETPDARDRLIWFGLIVLGLGVAFLGFVWQRRQISDRLMHNFVGVRMTQIDAYGPHYSGFAAFAAADRTAALALLVQFVLAGLVATIAVWQWGVAIAPEFGPATVTFLWAALIIPLGAAIAMAGAWSRIPLFVVILAAALVFGQWNDNHEIRYLAVNPQAGDSPAAAQGLGPEFAAWTAAQAQRRPARGPLPVILVSAEGGGIRAAYWAALILARLHDRFGEDFSDRIFAMSGVSGGSLGLGVFAAMRADAHFAPCAAPAASPPARPCEQAAISLLNRDFLSPVLAGLLFTDLTQRFLPVRIGAFDRARFLEFGWEDAYARAAGSAGGPNIFSQAFDALWQGERADRTPLLFLNSTQVHDGRRAIVAPRHVALPDPRSSAFLAEFPQAIDIAGIAPGPFRLSTAIGLSARFPLITPVGVISARDGQRRFADGGYFDNSAGLTLRDIVRAVRAERMRDDGGMLASMLRAVMPGSAPRSPDVFPVILHIVNDPDPDEAPPASGPFDFEQLLAPVEAVMNARVARSHQARAVLEEEVRAMGGMFVSFYLHDRKRVGIPLGWTLSPTVRTELRRQLDEVLPDPAAGNSAQLQAIACALRDPNPARNCRAGS